MNPDSIREMEELWEMEEGHYRAQVLNPNGEWEDYGEEFLSFWEVSSKVAWLLSQGMTARMTEAHIPEEPEIGTVVTKHGEEWERTEEGWKHWDETVLTWEQLHLFGDLL